jgi:hypothetical protein
VPDQSNFIFEANDLEIIHRAVSIWSLDNGYGVGHKATTMAARRAFFLYREGMTTSDLINLLHAELSTRH